ncbi:MAG: hypothetical protein PUP93_32655, partial [Rhizonema sp. NSF051]|nr:hypothetical protein [Rhizonema sp. NSF051]
LHLWMENNKNVCTLHVVREVLGQSSREGSFPPADFAREYSHARASREARRTESSARQTSQEILRPSHKPLHLWMGFPPAHEPQQDCLLLTEKLSFVEKSKVEALKMLKAYQTISVNA